MGIASTLVSVISKKTIKPFSPTPCTKIFHKLCLPGQAFTLNHIPLVLFYPKKPNIGPKKLCKFLEVSLSKTLAYYYPYAGRLINNWTAECNDNGAEFFEVRVNSGMDEVLHHSTDSRIKDIVTFPQGVPWSLDFMDSSSHHHHHHQALATAQLSHFDCGGIAISVCLSHKVGDAESVYRFLKDWAALTRCDDDSNNIVLSPYFVQDSILPSPADQGPLVSPVSKKKQECVEKTFDFTPAKLNALKASVNKSEEILQYPPTRSEVVNALVYKCAANAASSSLSDRSSPPAHQLVQYMNIRESISPPLPPTSIGNMLTVFSTPIHRGGDLTIAKVIANIRKSRDDDNNNNNNTRNKDQHNEWISEILHAYRTGKGTFQQRNCDVYISSSLCKYPFQEIDFGWGKPSRTRLGGHSISKYFVLMNTNDGGVHVSIHLTEKDMAVFENDHHLLQFATPSTEMKPESTVYGF